MIQLKRTCVVSFLLELPTVNCYCGDSQTVGVLVGLAKQHSVFYATHKLKMFACRMYTANLTKTIRQDATRHNTSNETDLQAWPARQGAGHTPSLLQLKRSLRVCILQVHHRTNML